MGIRIDDLVAPEAKTELTNFLATMESVKNRYVEICREMVAGISIKVTVIGDVDKLDNLVRVQSRELVQASSQMQGAATRLNGAIANTTNTISRQLAEQEDAGTEQLFRREGHAVAHDGRDEGLPFADVTVDRCPEICSELSSLCGIERLDVVDIGAFQIISRHL